MNKKNIVAIMLVAAALGKMPALEAGVFGSSTDTEAHVSKVNGFTEISSDKELLEASNVLKYAKYHLACLKGKVDLQVGIINGSRTKALAAEALKQACTGSLAECDRAVALNKKVCAEETETLDAITETNRQIASLEGKVKILEEKVANYKKKAAEKTEEEKKKEISKELENAGKPAGK